MCTTEKIDQSIKHVIYFMFFFRDAMFFLGINIQDHPRDRLTEITVSLLRIDDVRDSDVGYYDCIASLGQTGRLYEINDTISTFNYVSNIGKFCCLTFLYISFQLTTQNFEYFQPLLKLKSWVQTQLWSTKENQSAFHAASLVAFPKVR